MSGDRRSEPDARMLRRMVRELSEEPLPELEWEGIEARLFSELEEGGGRAAVASSPLAYGALDQAPHLEESFEPPHFVDEDEDDEIGADRPSAIPAAAGMRESLLPREPAAPRPATSFFARSRWLIAAAAIAAGLGGLFLANRHDVSGGAPVAVVAEPIDPAAVPQAPGMAPGVLDARSLGVGDVVEAALGPLAFGSLASDTDAAPGAVSWTLTAGSRALVREPASAIVHVVELESGSIRAEASGKKRIVVRALDTEIASVGQGAVFTVTRSSRGLVVHVEVGSVLVGERGQASKLENGQEAVAASSSRLLTAPMRAAVSLDGSRAVEVIPDEVAGPVPPSVEQPPQRVADEPAAERGPAEPARAPVAVNDARPNGASPPATPPQVPTAEAPVAPPAAAGPVSEASIRARVQGCFAQVQGKKSPNEGVAVSVSSTMRVTVRDDGSVQGVVFNPPLQSDLQGCAVFLFRENLGPGARSLSIAVAHR